MVGITASNQQFPTTHNHITNIGLAPVEAANTSATVAGPIGFAMVGFSILALGWFDQDNDVEDLLDSCRGVHDADDQYFYNVQHEGSWDIFNCFSGVQQQGFGRSFCTFEQILRA